MNNVIAADKELYYHAEIYKTRVLNNRYSKSTDEEMIYLPDLQITLSSDGIVHEMDGLPFLTVGESDATQGFLDSWNSLKKSEKDDHLFADHLQKVRTDAREKSITHVKIPKTDIDAMLKSRQESFDLWTHLKSEENAQREHHAAIATDLYHKIFSFKTIL